MVVFLCVFIREVAGIDKTIVDGFKVTKNTPNDNVTKTQFRG